MNPQFIRILKYMIEQGDVVTSSQLANEMGVSSRSVKSYIAKINEFADVKVITSSKEGYRVNTSLAKVLLSKGNSDFIPENFEQRSAYITKQFVIEKTNRLNIFDLAESLCVSESTIKSDINKMNINMRTFDITLKVIGEEVVLTGNERSLRKLHALTIYGDIGTNCIDLNKLKDEFCNLDVRTIVPIIKNTLYQYNYYINEVAINTVVLHIGIIMESILDGQHITTSEKKIDLSEEEKLISDTLAQRINHKYDVKLTEDEQYEIFMLVKMNANIEGVFTDNDSIKKYIGDNLLMMTDELIGWVEEKYHVSLSSIAFKGPFALHLKNLIIRSQNNQFLRNPMTDVIMNSHPIVFDMAISIAMQLIDKYNIKVTPHETAFLALHIGGEVERQKINQFKLKTLLLSPNYMDLNSKLYNSILLNFGNEMNLLGVISDPGAIDQYQIDLLISTVPLDKQGDYMTVYISPFVSPLNNAAIQNAIEKCLSNKKNEILRKRFDLYFNKEQFFYCDHIETRDQAIDLLAEHLLEKGYVEENFKEKVYSREKAAPTCFGQIAIPHSMDMLSYKTTVSVLINRNGIKWENQNVKVVLMMSIAQSSEEFSRLYEALVVLFSEPANIQLFERCKTFEEFKETLFMLVQ